MPASSSQHELQDQESRSNMRMKPSGATLISYLILDSVSQMMSQDAIKRIKKKSYHLAIAHSLIKNLPLCSDGKE